MKKSLWPMSILVTFNYKIHSSFGYHYNKNNKKVEFFFEKNQNSAIKKWFSCCWLLSKMKWIGSNKQTAKTDCKCVMSFVDNNNNICLVIINIRVFGDIWYGYLKKFWVCFWSKKFYCQFFLMVIFEKISGEYFLKKKHKKRDLPVTIRRPDSSLVRNSSVNWCRIWQR